METGIAIEYFSEAVLLKHTLRDAALGVNQRQTGEAGLQNRSPRALVVTNHHGAQIHAPLHLHVILSLLLHEVLHV
jgi:hypothetical protein